MVGLLGFLSVFGNEVEILRRKCRRRGWRSKARAEDQLFELFPIDIEILSNFIKFEKKFEMNHKFRKVLAQN